MKKLLRIKTREIKNSTNDSAFFEVQFASIVFRDLPNCMLIFVKVFPAKTPAEGVTIKDAFYLSMQSIESDDL